MFSDTGHTGFRASWFSGCILSLVLPFMASETRALCKKLGIINLLAVFSCSRLIRQ